MSDREIKNYLDIGHYGLSDYYLWVYQKGKLFVSKKNPKGSYYDHAELYSNRETTGLFDHKDKLTYSGRFECETGFLSIGKPWEKRHSDVPKTLLTRLFKKFNVIKYYEFD